ncbi:hypothetical protein LLEC1_04766 [Akanthomyces lecanii]|uniref:Protein kinase domain-containing protein n=1 Tax=Cordyceps confragosa TaxID=2714763 RepID=A0A179HZD5_CORDF|nr:hypothetical protein LLEC1_04766 [Akanthomyces lecanii]
MAVAPLVPCRRQYRICGYSQSNPQETPAWFSLQPRLNGKTFSIDVSESRFRNSPNRMNEFQNYVTYLASDEASESEDTGSMPENNDAHNGQDITIDDCFAWTVHPFIMSFRKLAPKASPTSKMTLQDYFNSESYECQLGAADDRLVPESIDLLDTNNSFIPKNCYIDRNNKHSSNASALFPTFPLSQIEILSDCPDSILDDEPRLVRVQGEVYFFKSFEAVGEDLGRREISKYEQIAMANFGPEIRTSRLFAIAQDEQRRIMGMLLHPIHEDTTLADALVPTTPESTRMRWKEQIRLSLQALHDAGIIWGDAKADNVIVDLHGDAWIIDFGGGYTEGWVDKDSSGTMAGDIEGLKNIVALLNTGGNTRVQIANNCICMPLHTYILVRDAREYYTRRATPTAPPSVLFYILKAPFLATAQSSNFVAGCPVYISTFFTPWLY